MLKHYTQQSGFNRCEAIAELRFKPLLNRSFGSGLLFMGFQVRQESRINNSSASVSEPVIPLTVA